MGEREWAETAPMKDVLLAMILRGLDGYPDDDTKRPIEILRTINRLYVETGHGDQGIERLDGTTVAHMRAWAERKFGSP